jgi:hypothetical protein
MRTPLGTQYFSCFYYLLSFRPDWKSVNKMWCLPLTLAAELEKGLSSPTRIWFSNWSIMLLLFGGD